MNNLPLESASIGWTENIRRAIANANGRLLGQLATFFTLQIVNDAQPAARRRSLALAVVPIGAAEKP